MDDSSFFGTISTIPIQLTFGEPKEKIVFLSSSTLFSKHNNLKKDGAVRDAK